MKVCCRVLHVVLATVALVVALFVAPRAVAQGRTDFSLTINPLGYPAEIRAGEPSRLFLEIKNSGTTTITGIKLFSIHPEGWVVELNPPEVETLTAGSLRTIYVTVRPPANARSGRHQVSLVAEASEMRREQVFFVVVKPASYWMWVGIGVVGVIVAVFALIFVRSGSQKEAR